MNKLHYNPWQHNCQDTGFIAGSEAWLAARRQAITASDLVVLKMNSTITSEGCYRTSSGGAITPLELYNKKVHYNPDEDIKGRQLEYGLHMEPLIIKWVQQEYSAHKIEPVNLHLASNYNPLHQCTIDGIFHIDNDIPCPLEIKTAIFSDPDDWLGDSIPEKYNIQIQWQLYITGAPGAYIACLPSGNTYKLIIKSVLPDKALQKELAILADRFLINLQKRIAPAALAEDLKHLPKPELEANYNPTDDFITLTRRLLASKGEEAKDIKAHMAQLMGVAAIADFELDGKQVTVTRKVIEVGEKVIPSYDYQKLTVKVN